MKRTFIALLAATLCAIFVVSCQKTPDNTPENQVEPDGIEVMRFWEVVGQLAGINEHTNDFKGKTFQPTIGIPDPSQPGVRIVSVNGLDQRWRINDNNAHLKSFLDENMEIRDKLRKYERL